MFSPRNDLATLAAWRRRGRRPETDLAFLLAQASHALGTELTARLSELGITPRAYCVLSKALGGELTQTQVAEQCALDKTTMVVTLDALERDGLAERRPSSTDRRARIIAVTEAGERVVAAGGRDRRADVLRRARSAAGVPARAVPRQPHAARRRPLVGPGGVRQAAAAARSARASAIGPVEDRPERNDLIRSFPGDTRPGRGQHEPRPPNPNRDTRWRALVVLCAGMLMIILDGTIVTVALPSIQSDLGFSQSSLAWVVNAYLIAFGGLLLLAGRLGDLIGRRLMFLSGLAVFTARLAAVRAGRQPGDADRRALRPGRRRRDGVGGDPGHDRDDVPRAARAGEGDRRLQLRRLGRRLDRAARRRRAHAGHQLALDLLRQHPDRHRDGRAGRAAARRRPRDRARRGRRRGGRRCS